MGYLEISLFLLKFSVHCNTVLKIFSNDIWISVISFNDPILSSVLLPSSTLLWPWVCSSCLSSQRSNCFFVIFIIWVCFFFFWSLTHYCFDLHFLLLIWDLVCSCCLRPGDALLDTSSFIPRVLRATNFYFRLHFWYPIDLFVWFL